MNAKRFAAFVVLAAFPIAFFGSLLFFASWQVAAAILAGVTTALVISCAFGWALAEVFG